MNFTTRVHDAQLEALKSENIQAESLRGLEKLLEKIKDGTRRRKPLSFEVGDKVLLKVSPWKAVARFGKRGKLNPRYIGPLEILEKIGTVAYKLKLPEELSNVHDTFHVSNLKKSPTVDTVIIPADGIHVDNTLQFTEEPVGVMDRKVHKTRRSNIELVKVRWNSRHGPEYTWEREDQI
ncbi:uncharacterized protein LOC118491536 [Helianthus annuus]|uniref:uncharacterized protein LOC118491536 n=1 Tax=Helianthus annuus TaxID=4232 RepID=UPI001652F283|nr:uncharacterized protein LOC118491536 [Helianthus annuus]